MAHVTGILPLQLVLVMLKYNWEGAEDGGRTKMEAQIEKRNLGESEVA